MHVKRRRTGRAPALAQGQPPRPNFLLVPGAPPATLPPPAARSASYLPWPKPILAENGAVGPRVKVEPACDAPPRADPTLAYLSSWSDGHARGQFGHGANAWFPARPSPHTPPVPPGPHPRPPRVLMPAAASAAVPWAHHPYPPYPGGSPVPGFAGAAWPAHAGSFHGAGAAHSRAGEARVAGAGATPSRAGAGAPGKAARDQEVVAPAAAGSTPWGGSMRWAKRKAAGADAGSPQPSFSSFRGAATAPGTSMQDLVAIASAEHGRMTVSHCYRGRQALPVTHHRPCWLAG